MSGAPATIARARNTIPSAWLDEIERRILRAEAPADFVPELAKLWGRGRRQTWKYVARVRARLAERAKAHDPEADREAVRSMVLETYRAARDEGDRKAQVSSAKLFADITGANAPKKIDVTSGGQPIEIARAALAASLARIAQEPDADGAGGAPGGAASGDL